MIGKCKNEINQDGLLVNIDLTDINSWDLNPDLKSISLDSWNESIVSEITLCDYGLTMVDVGKSIDMNETKTIDFKPYLSFEPISYNILSGNTSGNTLVNVESSISGVTGSSIGNYFQLSGGYLNTYFKLQEYDYKILPTRYNNGFTIENKIQITPNSNGMFFYMGTRAEDKYNPYFSGETYSYIEETEESVRTGNMGEQSTIIVEELVYDGVKTSAKDLLYSLKDDVEKKKAFNDFADSTNDILVDVPQLDNIKSNALGFFITNDKKIGYKYVNEKGLISSDESKNKISYDIINSGWTTISITFKPYLTYSDLNDENELCYESRIGDLIIYVGGRKFWKIESFDEFYFKPIRNNREKAIGVPYNLSWGGGTYGLDYSYHYDVNKSIVYLENDLNYVNDKFTIKNFENSCTSNVILDVDSTTFIDDDDKFINVLDLAHTGDTGTTCNSYYFEFNDNYELYPNRKYRISAKVSKDYAFQEYSDYTISIVPFGDDDLIVHDSKFINQNDIDEWNEMYIDIEINNNCEKQIIMFGINIESDKVLSDDFNVYFDEIIMEGSDNINTDNEKNNLTIAKNFNSSYIGGLQKLRIYDRALNSREVLMNASIDNNINNRIGGRIIHR